MKNNFLIKNIMFLLLFLVVLVIFLVIYIIPELKEYKTKQAILKKSEKIYFKNIKSLKSLEKERDLTYKKYQKNIEKYNKNFDIENFKSYMKSILKDSTIEVTKEKDKLNIKATINDKEEIYTLLEKLNRYTNIVKVDFPFEYKNSKSNKNITFYVTICNKKLKNCLNK